nr:transcriptional regulator war1 [Quercus suber]
MPDSEIPSHRACAHCRSQKVRCIVDDAAPDQCQRCSRSGRPCIFTPLQKRKQRKRTDTRVAELEKEMRAMRSLIKQQQNGGDQVGSPPTEVSPEAASKSRSDHLSTAQLPEDPSSVRSAAPPLSRPAPTTFSSDPGPVYVAWHSQGPGDGSAASRLSDVVSRGVISDETARQLFAAYPSLFYHFPVVVIPEHVTADQMRKARPTLFLAIIAAAAGKINSELSAILDRELLLVYATRATVNSEKSLEIVQALLTSTVWYHPPRKFGQLKYYEYTHMAAIMAMDIGIDSKPRKPRTHFSIITPGSNGILRNAYQHPAEDARDPDLSMVPRSKVDVATVNSEKSLEIVQALLTSTVWYHPPRKFGQLKYYEYTHMAAIMAMDIGIDSKPRKPRTHFSIITPGSNGILRNAYQHPAEDARDPDLSMVPRSKVDVVDTTSIDSRRTFLAVFMVCVGVSLSLRRPNILRTTTYLNECIEVVEQSSQAVETDRLVVAWAKLLIIGEEICTSFSYNDLGNVASLAELKTQMMLREFQRRLDTWWANHPVAETNGALTIMYHTVRAQLFEVALHIEHSPEDFKAPLQMGSIRHYDGPEIPTLVLAEAIAGCITSSHAICATFLSMDVDLLRSLPVFSYVRLSYATFVLVKLCLSAVHPNSRIAQVLNQGSLQVESYVDRMILHARNIVGPTRCRIPAIFLALLFKLRQWCLHPEMIVQADHDPRRASSEADSPSGSSYGLDQGEEQRAGGKGQGYALSYSSSISPDLDGSQTTDSVPPMLYTNYGGGSGNDQAASAMDRAGVNPSMNYAQSTADQMALDKDFMDLWNEMNGFPEGGLTGLEDWDQLPTDMTGTTSMSDMSTWPNLGAMM